MSRFNVIVNGVGKKELTNHKTLFSSLASSQNGKISKNCYFCHFGNFGNFEGEFQTWQMQVGWWPQYNLSTVNQLEKEPHIREMGRFSKVAEDLARLDRFFVNLMTRHGDKTLRLVLLAARDPGGGTPIWNRRGCSSEILNLTPKGDHLGVTQTFCDP